MVSSTVQAAIEAPVVNARWLAYLDFDGDPLRATTALYPVTFGAAETGDAELDGLTFDTLDSDLVNIGDVTHSDSGSDTVPASLSGLVLNNSDVLAIIGDASKWQGRTARLWWFVTDVDGTTRVGEVVPYYTGYMSAATISGSPDSQTVTVEIENYLASLTGAAGRTYLSQKEYDSGDLSANATLACANGVSGIGAAGKGGGPGVRQVGGNTWQRSNFLDKF